VGFVSQVGLEQGAANGRPAEPPLSRPAPHRRHVLGGHGRDAQRADGPSQALQCPGVDDLPARHPRPWQVHRSRARQVLRRHSGRFRV